MKKFSSHPLYPLMDVAIRACVLKVSEGVIDEIDKDMSRQMAKERRMDRIFWKTQRLRK